MSPEQTTLGPPLASLSQCGCHFNGFYNYLQLLSTDIHPVQDQVSFFDDLVIKTLFLGFMFQMLNII
jgi:hypothetical protein